MPTWTLYECLVTLSRLLAPFTPFFAEEIYQNLAVRSLGDAIPDSVHLADFPVADESLIDRDLSDRMAAAREIVSLGLAARSANRLKVRQPLQAAQVGLADPTMRASVQSLDSTIAEELNVKSIEFPESVEAFVHYEVRPNFKALGPKIGKRVPLVQTALKAADPATLKAELDASGAVELPLADGTSVTLESSEVEVRLAAREGFAAEGGRVGVVLLDTALTPALISEGLARELVNRIQTVRKDLDLDYVDRIRVWVDGDDEVRESSAHSATSQRRDALRRTHLGRRPGGDPRTDRQDRGPRGGARGRESRGRG